MRQMTLVMALALAGMVILPTAQAGLPQFEAVQPDLFAAPGGQPNAWADFDNDGDLDLFVGFARRKAQPSLSQTTVATFVEVATSRRRCRSRPIRGRPRGATSMPTATSTCTSGSRGDLKRRNKLYRNDGAGKPFTDVAGAMGVDAMGETRQVSWVDVDNDGDLDLFVAMRDAPNLLFRNDGDRFIDAAKELGLDDPRRTVGAVWFDADEDGDLDLFVANQNGDANGLFQNPFGGLTAGTAHGSSTSRASAALDAPGRPETSGSNGPSVADVDGDGDLDLFVAGYGGNFLYRNDGRGKFTEMAAQFGIAGGEKATPSRWGDFDNDGRPDLYVSSYVDTALNEHDFLYHHDGNRLTDVRAALKFPHGATHGVQWADFDGDGDLDLALANNNPSGAHPLYRNLLPPAQCEAFSRSHGASTSRDTRPRAGSEVRVYAAGTRKMLGAGLIDTGSGYCSQNVMPVHVGLPSMERVDIEVTALTKRGRVVTRLTGSRRAAVSYQVRRRRGPDEGPTQCRPGRKRLILSGEE